MKDVMNVEAAELAVLIKISSGSIPKAATESFSVWRNKKPAMKRPASVVPMQVLFYYIRKFNHFKL